MIHNTPDLLEDLYWQQVNRIRKLNQQLTYEQNERHRSPSMKQHHLLTRVLPACLALLVATTGTLLNPESVEAAIPQAQLESNTAVQIPVGMFITSIYGIDFRSEQYTVTFWLWATFPTEKMKEILGTDYVPFNTIEVVNAQNKTISPTDQYIILDSETGNTYAIAKFTATINQH